MDNDDDRPMTREELLDARAKITEQLNELEKVPHYKAPYPTDLANQLYAMLDEIEAELAELGHKDAAGK